MPEEWPKPDVKHKKCVAEYRFSNPSLGPINGERSFRVYLNEGSVEKVVDLRTNKPADPALGTPGLRAVLSALEGNVDSSMEVRYDPKRNVMVLTPKSGSDRTGGYYRIELRRVECREN